MQDLLVKLIRHRTYRRLREIRIRGSKPQARQENNGESKGREDKRTKDGSGAGILILKSGDMLV